MEDTPDFSFDPATCPYRAGVRPFRDVTYRLESKTLGNKFIVHNYGHGGAGITMSWGCAEAVLQKVVQNGVPRELAVLGAGVMGLTAATLLADLKIGGANIAVTVYADKFTPQTTSDVAGGQWAPSLVNFEEANPAAKLAYFDILRMARKAHESRIGAGFGVSRRWNYTTAPIDHLRILPTDIVPTATELPHLPFARLNKPGLKYDLLLVEPPILMSRLQADLESRITFVKRKFSTINEVLSLKEKVIVNCTGVGAGRLFNDPLVKPLKGQLVFLKPKPNLNYLFSGSHSYVFPRTDAVVVGGSQEWIDNNIPDPAQCKRIVAHAKDVFDGKTFLAADLEDWMIRNK
jgi:glycine/D-amino acid oxidase-like deaminating enzyme